MTNAELAQRLRDLRDFLIIAGYEESHALRYTHIARSIESMSDSAEELDKAGKLTDIPQVGKLIALYIHEILTTGTSSKQLEWEEQAPFSVVEMCRVKGLGPKTAKTLFVAYGIKSLGELKTEAASGRLDRDLSERLRTEIASTQ